jgi:hypothetical protein
MISAISNRGRSDAWLLETTQKENFMHTILKSRHGRTALAMIALFIAGRCAHSQNVAFHDSFEGAAVYPFWNVAQSNGSISLSTDHAYAGSHALRFAPTSGGDRNIVLSHQFPSSVKGTVSVAFYDAAPGTQTLYEQLRVSDSRNPALVASVGTMDFDSQCYEAFLGSTGPNASCGIYPQFSTSPIRRSSGWHVLTIAVGQSTVAISIDGVKVTSVPGDYQFDTISLSVSGPPWRPDTVAYFDDFQFTPFRY